MPDDTQRLVVLGSTVTALAIVRNCHQLGLPCTVVDTREDPATRSRLAEVRVINDDDDEGLLTLLEALAADGNTALIADSDRWLRWLMRHRQALDKLFDTVLHPSNRALELCLNKSRFIHWCEDQAIPAPAIYDVAEAGDDSLIVFPVLVRPEQTRHGSADDLPKAIEITDSSQLRSLLSRYEELGAVANVCQSLLRPNVRQYSVGVARNRLGDRKIFVAEKRRPSAAMCAGGTYVVASPEDNVASLVAEVISKLDLFGIAEVEVIQDTDTDELFVLEVNARPWVQYGLAASSGFDFLRFMLKPESYDPRTERARGGRWLSFSDDLYVVFSRSEGMLTRRDVSLTEYLRSVITSNAFAFWALEDPKPFLVHTWRRFFKPRRLGSSAALLL